MFNKIYQLDFEGGYSAGVDYVERQSEAECVEGYEDVADGWSDCFELTVNYNGVKLNLWLDWDNQYYDDNDNEIRGRFPTDGCYSVTGIIVDTFSEAKDAIESFESGLRWLKVSDAAIVHNALLDAYSKLCESGELEDDREEAN